MHDIFTPKILEKLFPKERTDAFFEALFGDAEDGAYNIGLAFKESTSHLIHFEFQLTPRPGRCLACNLTYGLPGLFSRHPIINVNGLVKKICEYIPLQNVSVSWRLGQTREISPSFHAIPLLISLNGSAA